MYYVITKGGGEGVRKWQFLITFSTESNHKGGRGGGHKPQNLDYVIHGCSLSKLKSTYLMDFVIGAYDFLDFLISNSKLLLHKAQKTGPNSKVNA